MFSYKSTIEQNFITGSNELMVPGRVTTCCIIPQGAISETIEPGSLIGQVDVAQVCVGMGLRGTIEINERSKETWPQNVHWIRAVRLADDCHSYNVQLRLQSPPLYSTVPPMEPKRQQNSKLVLQTVKPIEAGEELLMWFSEDILAILQVAFLTPANIQGQKKYVCTKCSALYESPNPLKLHISLECSRYAITKFWEQLAYALANSTKEEERKNNFTFRLIPETHLLRQRSAIDLTTSANNIKSENLYKPYSQPSAFRPFRKNQNNTATSAFSHSFNVLPFATQLSGDSSLENQAQIETLVSSLGKSKQGHICLYCGKCYSRKYGLKIHIRTHTGYKPLKCKFCLRPFGDPSNLNKHVRLHAEGDTPYKCELCGKILVRRRDLERHLKSRHMCEIYPGSSVLEDSNESINTSEEEKEEKHIISDN